MKGLTHFLYRNSVFCFILFFLFALLAFWTSYYGVLTAPRTYHLHLHGIGMTLWCAMLISQAMLIRVRKYAVHRVMGKLSYVLVPFIIVSGVHLSHYTIKGATPGTGIYYYLVALMFNALIVFTIFYTLAMWNRKKPMIHARYMLCTIFPLFTPITDRIIYKYIDGFVPLAPVLEGMPIVPTFGFVLAELITIGLLIWDWRAHKKLNVFPLVLVVLIIYHISVWTFHGYDFWRKIGDAVMSLPLS